MAEQGRSRRVKGGPSSQSRTRRSASVPIQIITRTTHDHSDNHKQPMIVVNDDHLQPDRQAQDQDHPLPQPQRTTQHLRVERVEQQNGRPVAAGDVRLDHRPSQSAARPPVLQHLMPQQPLTCTHTQRKTNHPLNHKTTPKTTISKASIHHTNSRRTWSAIWQTAGNAGPPAAPPRPARRRRSHPPRPSPRPAPATRAGDRPVSTSGRLLLPGARSAPAALPWYRCPTPLVGGHPWLAASTWHPSTSSATGRFCGCVWNLHEGCERLLFGLLLTRI